MADSGQFILAVLRNTPWWTWVLLAYLILQGIRAMRGGSTSLLRLSIVPIAFAAWGLWGIFDRFDGSRFSIAIWLMSVGIGFTFGMVHMASLNVGINKRERTLELPGSSIALISGLLVFMIKYVLAVLSAIHPQVLTETWFLIVDVGITGLVAGLFAGRLFNLWQRYRTAVASASQTFAG